MKKILFIIAALLVANFASAAWSEPSGNPPTNNVPAPINVGNVYQVKSNGIGATKFCIGNYCLGTVVGGPGNLGIINNTNGNSMGGILTGGGATDYLAIWTGANSLGQSPYHKSQIDFAVSGGFWKGGGIGIIPSGGQVVDGAYGLRVQMGAPGNPRDGMIWLE